MKTLFIHLSDLHLNENICTNVDAKSLARNMRDKIESSGNIFIIFTGDFVNRGNDTNEFVLFKTLLYDFVDEVTSLAPSSNVRTILVPGNHDLDLSDEGDDYIIPLNKNHTSEEMDLFSDNSMHNCKNALELCRAFGCFTKNDYIDECDFESEGVIYHFLLINSAPLSSKIYVDKEHHHIPKQHLNLLHQKQEIGKKTIEIVLSHHRPDWFDYETASSLNAFIANKSSLVFYGHDHQQDEKVVITNNNSIVVMQGGELVSKENNLLGSFNVVVLDEDNFSFVGGKYYLDFNSDEQKYEDIVLNQTIQTFQPYKNTKTFVDNTFIISLKNHRCSTSDVFVMPTLYKNEKPYMSDFNQLVSYIFKNKILYVKGNAKCGKSILLKHLYLEFSKHFVPVLLKCNQHVSPVIKNAVDSAFIEQYKGGNEKLKAFDALSKDKKVILIDNFHSLKREVMEKMISYAKEHFEYVIVAYTSSYDPTKRLFEDSIIDFDHLFEILSFTFLNRKNYVNKICHIMDVNVENVDKVFKTYESTIGTSKILDFGDPEYALLLIENIISNNYYEGRHSESAFSIAFTYSVQNAFMNAGCEGKLENCIQLTSWLARDVWKRDSSSVFSEEFIHDSFTRCSNYYGNITIKFSRYLSLLLDSEIIIENGEDCYSFRRMMYLSYFTGLQISSDYKSKNRNDLDYLLNNIGHSLNSDVLLFVVYELKEKDLFDYIDKEINNIFPDCEPINFNTKNNVILKSVGKGDVFLEKEITFTKAEYEAEKDEEEKNNLPSVSSKNNQLSQNEDKEENSALKSLKLIEIMAKALSGFSTLFNAEERGKYLSDVNNACLRLAQKLFTINPDQFAMMKSVLERIREIINEESKHKKAYEKLQTMFNSISLEGLLYNYLVNVVSSIEFSVSDWASSGISIPIIDKIDSTQITNCLFKLCSYIHMGSFEKYKNQLKKVLDSYEDDNPTTIIFHPTVIMYILQNVVSNNELLELSKVSGISCESLKKMSPAGQIDFNKL